MISFINGPHPAAPEPNLVDNVRRNAPTNYMLVMVALGKRFWERALVIQRRSRHVFMQCLVSQHIIFVPSFGHVSSAPRITCRHRLLTIESAK